MINRIEEYLLIGADSNLGRSFFEHLKTMNSIILSGTSNKRGTDFKYFNLKDRNYSFSSPSGRGKALIFASKPNHSFCEQFPDEAFEINVASTLRLVNHLCNLGWETVIFSSAQVFSGKHGWMKTSDVPDPLSTYGKQKVDLENLLGEYNLNTIIRVTKILNLAADPFGMWINNLRKSEFITPFKDYPISPISLPSLFQGSLCIMTDFMNGIWHLGNSEQTDYYSLAKLIAQNNNLNTELIKSVDPQSIKMEHYPKFASLDSSLTALKTNWRPENLLEAVKSSRII